ncbi:MAG: hypothetical protein NW200_13015 [Hyphomonadaceae bacterium]|nr:hypothetical protein [Hyphomonadaceae bacterium]
MGGNVIGAVRGASSLGPLANTVFGAAAGVGAAYGVQSGGLADRLGALLGDNPAVVDGVSAFFGGLALLLVASFFKRGS